LIVSDLSPRSLRQRLHGTGLRLRTGPVVAEIRSRLRVVADGLFLHYAEHAIEASTAFVDFHVSVQRPRGPRHWIAPQAVFRFDGMASFAPLPVHQGFPMLEWGLNWCVSNHCHQFLVIHAAVLERGGRALLLPAPSGSGKSTLCAGLSFHGWRLLSDELALIDPERGFITPLPRPVSLKNESIHTIRSFVPQAIFGSMVSHTVKGTVAYVTPPKEAVMRSDEAAVPAWIVFPQFSRGAKTILEPLPKARAFMSLIECAFNYNVHGRQGFAALTRLIDTVDCYSFSYSCLKDAVEVFDRWE
jgi:HprK-related kinase A